MVSATPVHNLTATYQFTIVKEAAEIVEKSGGIVVGSMTDNHKINQHNNWISEKCQKLSLDKKIVGSFADVQSLYQVEKDSVLKSTPLTGAAVFPSRLQLQNVQHVLSVFNDRVIAALKVRGANETATLIEQILSWWNIVNVSGKRQDVRMRDPNRSVQVDGTSSLQPFLELFQNTESGHGSKRVECLTHDTKKALVQTTKGLIAVCRHLFKVGFQYVLLRELQSDRIEGEFSVYRQSTGANAFMLVGDVFSAFKKRLARFSTSFLKTIENEQIVINSHTCSEIDFEDAAAIESCISDVTLSETEECAVVYVAGWLERKCEHYLSFQDEEPLISGVAKDFIDEMSRGFLTVPHVCTCDLVRTGLGYVKKVKHKACCSKKLISALSTISIFYDIQLTSKPLLRHLANVLLHGLHNLEKDHQRNLTLYQTSVKKARLAD